MLPTIQALAYGTIGLSFAALGWLWHDVRKYHALMLWLPESKTVLSGIGYVITATGDVVSVVLGALSLAFPWLIVAGFIALGISTLVNMANAARSERLKYNI